MNASRIVWATGDAVHFIFKKLTITELSRFQTWTYSLQY